MRNEEKNIEIFEFKLPNYLKLSTFYLSGKKTLSIRDFELIQLCHQVLPEVVDMQ